MADETMFRALTPRFMRQIMADFPGLTAKDAAAVFGNAGHESNGYMTLQEKKPLAGRGGWGFFQWTGARRRAFEAYCRRNELDPADPYTNYAWLFLELKGSEKAAIPALKRARSLRDKVVAFEMSFERAHPKYKHYDSRVAWAKVALDAFNANGGDEPVPSPQPHYTGLIGALVMLIREIAATIFRR